MREGEGGRERERGEEKVECIYVIYMCVLGW